jgi:hypothetical protein
MKMHRLLSSLQRRNIFRQDLGIYTLHNKKKLKGLGNKLQELILIPIRKVHGYLGKA